MPQPRPAPRPRAPRHHPLWRAGRRLALVAVLALLPAVSPSAASARAVPPNPVAASAASASLDPAGATVTATVPGVVTVAVVDLFRVDEPAEVRFVQVGGTALGASPALTDGLARGQAVSVTLTGPAGLGADALVARAGAGDPAVTVTGVTAVGPAPAPAVPPTPAAAHSLTVLPVRWTGATDVGTRSPQSLADTSAERWAEASGGRLSTTTDVRPWAILPGTPTCDPATLANLALAAHGVPAPRTAAQHVLVYTESGDCPAGTTAAVGGSLLWANNQGGWHYEVAHAFGHNLGLAHSRLVPCPVPSGPDRIPFCAPTAEPPASNRWPAVPAPVAVEWGWSKAVEPTDRALEARLVPAGDGVHAIRVPVAGGGPVVVESREEGRVVVGRLDLEATGAATTYLTRLEPGEVHHLDGSGYVLSVGDPRADHERGTPVRLVPEGSDRVPPVPVTITSPTAPPVWHAAENATVRWTGGTDAGAGVAGHTVLVDGTPVSILPADRTTDYGGNLAPGRHTVQVVTTDAAGNSARSAVRVFDVGQAPQLHPVEVEAGDRMLSLRWQDPGALPAVTSYTLVLSDGRVLELPGSATSAEVTGLANGRWTSFSLIAHHLLGESTSYGSGTPSEPSTWIRVTSGAEPWEYRASPVSIEWELSPRVRERTAFLGIEVDGRPLRLLAADAIGIRLPMLPDRHHVGVVAYDADGTEIVHELIEVSVDRSAPPLFADVPTSHPFHDEVFWLAQSGVTTGYADGTFRPSSTISREAMAAYFFRLAAADLAGYEAPAVSPFSDVATGDRFYREVAWFREIGMTTGYADGTFRPGASVSREAMAAFLYRFAEVPDGEVGVPAEPPFLDVPTSARFVREITWLAGTGISRGYSDGTFGPGLPVQRDAMAAFLSRLVHGPAADVASAAARVAGGTGDGADPE